jgi:methionyl-tRNA formyltransferase
MSKSKKLVFFGNERLATGLEHTSTPTIKALIKEDYEIVAVISSYTKGRSRSARKLEITEVAEAHNIPLMLPTHLRDIKDDIKNLNADFGVLVAYGKIIPQEIINIFPKGIINIHPSLLPKYRGPTPIEQAILDGATESGTSIMRLVAEMDAGPVYAQAKIALKDTESKAGLAEKLLHLGVGLLVEHLPQILENPQSYTEQDDSRATYTMLITKEDGLVDWNKPAEQIEREIRAYSGWPKSRAKLHDKDVVITKARVAKDGSDGTLVIECQPGWLEVQQLTAPSGRNMSASEFLRGYSSRS